jgi:hypothetical protein
MRTVISRTQHIGLLEAANAYCGKRQAGLLKTAKQQEILICLLNSIIT